MTRAKHYNQSWRVMKDNTKSWMKVSKLCKKCIKECKHQSIGELTYCLNFSSKESINEKM